MDDKPDADRATPSFRARDAFAIISIMLVAAVLRLYRIRDTGILSVDEGRYLLDGYAVSQEFSTYIAILAGKFNEIRTGMPFHLSDLIHLSDGRLREVAPFFPKVLYSWCIALLSLVVGFKPWLGNAVEATFGVATIGLLFGFAQKLWNKNVAYIAALLLTCSPYHVFYSRNAYPQSIAVFFFIAACWLHLESLRTAQSRFRSLSFHTFTGIACGLAFAANYQVSGALPALALIHFVTSMTTHGQLQKSSRLWCGVLAMLAGFLAPLILFELSTYPLILMFRSEGMPFPHPTFLELLSPRVSSHASMPFNATGLVLYPYFLWRFDRLLPLLFVVAAVAIGVRRKDQQTSMASPSYSNPNAIIYVTILFLVPWLLFSTKTIQGARMFSFSHPFFYLFTAWMIDTAARRVLVRGWRFQYAALLTIVVVALALPGLREVLAIRAGWPEVIAHVKSTPRVSTYASFSSVLEVYLRSEDLPGGNFYLSPSRVQELKWYFVAADMQELYDKRYPDESPALIGAGPRASFRHEISRLYIETEFLAGSGNTLENIRAIRAIDTERAKLIWVAPANAPAVETEAPVTAPQ